LRGRIVRPNAFDCAFKKSSRWAHCSARSLFAARYGSPRCTVNENASNSPRSQWAPPHARYALMLEASRQSNRRYEFPRVPGDSHPAPGRFSTTYLS
jgi:hypothetical protein